MDRIGRQNIFFKGRCLGIVVGLHCDRKCNIAMQWLTAEAASHHNLMLLEPLGTGIDFSLHKTHTILIGDAEVELFIPFQTNSLFYHSCFQLL
jgi:hypothetical protein